MAKANMSPTRQPMPVQDPTLRARNFDEVALGYTEEMALAEAARKCREKRLEFVVANDVTEKGAGFGCNTNRVKFVFPDGAVRELPLMSKRLVARRIVDEVLRA